MKNGTIEIANIHKGDFCDLKKNTKMNGTPDLENRLEQSISFEPILINSGDVVIFISKCPHRSRKNKSKHDRRTIYYTYNPENEGDNYSLFNQNLYYKILFFYFNFNFINNKDSFYLTAFSYFNSPLKTKHDFLNRSVFDLEQPKKSCYNL